MYPKPHKSFEEQVRLLQERGLAIDDVGAARDLLASTNYYRFTGYALPFMLTREQFKPGANFHHVAYAMRLDARLRDLLATALEHIEIDFRTTFAYEHSKLHGPLGYMEGGHFQDPQKHRETMAKVEKEISNSRETCISHLKEKYGVVPVWAMVEVVPFGCVVGMYGNMRRQDKPRIARRYNLQADMLGSYIHHASVVRNMCAHYARIWDKTFYGPRPSGNWPQVAWSAMDTRRLFYTLVLIYRMTRQISTECFNRAAWKQGLKILLNDFQTLPHCAPCKIMGIPENGFNDVWWE